MKKITIKVASKNGQVEHCATFLNKNFTEIKTLVSESKDIHTNFRDTGFDSLVQYPDIRFELQSYLIDLIHENEIYELKDFLEEINAI